MYVKKIFTLLFTVLLVNNSILVAQEFGKLRGFVTDSTNGEALAYGNVYIEELNTGTSTDARGYYILNNVPANKYLTIIISYLGYKTQKTNVKVSANKIVQLNINLVPESLELQAIEKIGEKVQDKNPTDIGLQKLTLRQLEILPKGVETDVFRSLQYLPGVQSTGDVSARYYVGEAPVIKI